MKPSLDLETDYRGTKIPRIMTTCMASTPSPAAVVGSPRRLDEHAVHKIYHDYVIKSEPITN